MHRWTGRLFVCALVVLVGGSLVAWAQTPLKVGEMKPYHAETPHPYPLGTESRPVVWTDQIISPGAEFVRVHFSHFSLAPGDYVTVSSPDGSQVWTYTGNGPHHGGDILAFAIDGDTAIVQIHGGKGNGHGYLIDAVGHGTAPLGPRHGPSLEVICGTDGREDVACESAVNSVQGPVARLIFQSGGSLFACTGWLVAGSNVNTLITNNHCFSTQTEVNTLQATFNFQRLTCGGSINAGTDFAGGTFLKTNSLNKHGQKGGLDYTLTTLLGNPSASFGQLTATTKSVGVGDLIYFIQHPGGNEKKVGFYEDAPHTIRCKVDAINQTYSRSATGSQTAYGCDSEGGASGSPIVDVSSGHVAALHHFGGVSSSPCLNSGSQLSKICADAGSLLSCASN